jgi:hypothetical protein
VNLDVLAEHCSVVSLVASKSTDSADGVSTRVKMLSDLGRAPLINIMGVVHSLEGE